MSQKRDFVSDISGIVSQKRDLVSDIVSQKRDLVSDCQWALRTDRRTEWPWGVRAWVACATKKINYWLIVLFR